MDPESGRDLEASVCRFCLSLFSVSAAITATWRKQAEEGPRESEERFRQLTENIREVFWLTEPDKNQMIYISPGYEEIWESPYRSPRSWLDAIHLEDRNRVIEAALTKQVRGTYNEEYRIVRPDGSIRWIQDRAFPIRNESGEVDRIAGMETISNSGVTCCYRRGPACWMEISTQPSALGIHCSVPNPLYPGSVMLPRLPSDPRG